MESRVVGNVYEYVPLAHQIEELTAEPRAVDGHARQKLMLNATCELPTVVPSQVRVGMTAGREAEVLEVAWPNLIVLRDVVAIGRQYGA